MTSTTSADGVDHDEAYRAARAGDDGTGPRVYVRVCRTDDAGTVPLGALAWAGTRGLTTLDRANNPIALYGSLRHVVRYSLHSTLASSSTTPRR